MKALVATDYGPPETYSLADIPVPEPGPGQLQVRVAAVSINPGDARIVSGEFREQTALTFPHVPGNDFAGTVSRVGEVEEAYRVGDEIFGMAVPRALRDFVGGTRPSLSTGALAEYAVVEADTPFLARRPVGIGVADAAALPMVGLTARALAATARIQPGETVLVVGATGGVGTAVLPLLPADAKVIATSTPADAELLRELGAAETIGYNPSGYPSGVDVVVNLTVPGDRLGDQAAALRPGGRLVSITFPFTLSEWLGRNDIDVAVVYDMEGVLGGMREVARAAEDGALRATIARRYAFEDAGQAVVDFERRHTTGKLVVEL